jgi:hypothetical protein
VKIREKPSGEPAVTDDDRKKCVQTIRERVSLILCPLGILVEHEMKSGRGEAAEFTFKIPDADKAKPGVYQEVTIHLTQHDVQQCLTDPAQLDCLPRAWARICADWAPTLFDGATLPTADGVDWRPQETLPEDFYAA